MINAFKFLNLLHNQRSSLYLGVNESTGEIVNHSREGVKWICGVGLLDNHSVNFLSSIFTAILGPYLSAAVW